MSAANPEFDLRRGSDRLVSGGSHGGRLCAEGRLRYDCAHLYARFSGDELRPYHAQAIGNATFTQQINSDAVSTIKQQRVELHSGCDFGGLGAHSLKIARTGTGSALYTIGVRAYNANTKHFECVQHGEVWGQGLRLERRLQPVAPA